MSEEMEKALAEQPGGKEEKQKPVDAKAKPVAGLAKYGSSDEEEKRKPIAAKAKPVGPAKYVSSSRGGGGGMNPTDIEKVKKPGALKMKSGGMVSASKRADGCAVKGKTRGKMV
jgi:hypothetical protein